MRRSVLALALAVFACETADQPVDPVWGKQACGSCAMLVSEPAHAAQLATADGTRVFFDDLGCLVEYQKERGAAKKLWVRTSEGRWVDAKTAKYKGGAKTPMDYGFTYAADGTAEFADVEDAVKKKSEARR